MSLAHCIFIKGRDTGKGGWMAWHPWETGDVVAPKKPGRQVQARPGTWRRGQSSAEQGGEVGWKGVGWGG